MHGHKTHAHARKVQLCSSQETWSSFSTFTMSSVIQVASIFLLWILYLKMVFLNCSNSEVATKASNLLGMNIWREDAFFHWKFCKFLTYERTYLPVFCFLCVLHVPFLRGEQVMRNKTEMNELFSSKMFWPCNETVPWK